MIDFIFHIINFGLLIALGVYAFKRYALSSLRQEMTTEELAHAALQKRLDSLKKQESHLLLAAQHQKALYEDQLKKIDIWRAATAVIEQEHQARLRVIAEKTNKRHCDKWEYQQRAAIEAMVMPRALAGAERELIQLFASPERAERFTAVLVNLMKKGE
jgi:hypothetical protein